MSTAYEPCAFPSRFEFEESAEFLQPVDNPPVLVDEDDYQALEDIKTTIYKPHSNTHFSYGNEVPWQLKIRKEIFSPSEVVKSPLAINLIFCQVKFWTLFPFLDFWVDCFMP